MADPWLPQLQLLSGAQDMSAGHGEEDPDAGGGRAIFPLPAKAGQWEPCCSTNHQFRGT